MLINRSPHKRRHAPQVLLETADSNLAPRDTHEEALLSLEFSSDSWLAYTSSFSLYCCGARK